MAISAESTDGKAHDVQLYSDISAEWVSGDDSLTVNWTTSTTGSIITHQVQLEDQTLYGEVDDHTQCDWLHFIVHWVIPKACLYRWKRVL